MPPALHVADYIAAFPSSPLAALGNIPPWELTSRAAGIVQQLLASLPGDEFAIHGDVACH